MRLVAAGRTGLARPAAPEAAIAGAVPLWLPIGMVAGFALCVFLAAGFRIDLSLLLTQLALPASLGAIGQLCLRRGCWPRLARAATALAQAAALAVAGMMLTYAAATVDRPFVDAHLLSFDRAIGYDWYRYALFVRAHPAFARLLERAYALIFALPIVITYVLAHGRHYRRIDLYLLAILASVILTAAVFAFCPALTAWDHLRVDPRVIDRLDWITDRRQSWERDLLAIRAGHGLALHDRFGSGLAAFPSYHCVAGLLFAWALWPVRRARVPVAAAAALLIASAPIFGGHYLADLAGGAVVAAGSVALAYRIEPLLCRRPSHAAERPATA